MPDLGQIVRRMPPEQQQALRDQMVRQYPPRPAFTLGKQPMDWSPLRGMSELALSMAPGSGDVMAAQDSQAAGQRMADAYEAGDYGGAFGAMLESFGHGLGALPLVPAFGGMVKAFHGSPHRFDQFSMDKIGTGEGAQAYGHGLYFAENPGVAGSYKTAGRGAFGGSAPVPWLDGKPINWDEVGEDASIAIQSIDDPLVGANIPEKVSALRQHGMAGAADWLEKNHSRVEMNSGALYNVSLDVEPEDLLDWDAPLSQQSEKVKKALEPHATKIRARMVSDASQWGKPSADELASYTRQAEEITGRMTGEGAYQKLGTDLAFPGREWHGLSKRERDIAQEAASRALAEAGIPGLRYFDAGSRGKGEGSRNVVMFRDDLIKIEGVDGEPVRKAAGMTLDDFQDDLKGRLGLSHLSLSQSGNDLRVNMIEVPKGSRGQGVGTEAMQSIVKYADQNGLRIRLTPGLKDKLHGTTSRSRLVDFYKRFGFVENRGRNKDFSLNADEMFRGPVK